MRRIVELDSLRGLAALAIVASHLWFPHHGYLGTGVDLFFVLSGYLITAIILKQRDRPGFLAQFFARRALRIWPIYYLSLLVLVAINPALPRPFPLDGLPYYLAYAQNLPHYWGGDTPAFFHGFTHTWSLAVEEQYYVFWPIALVVLGRRSLVPLALALVAVAIGARAAGFSKWVLVTHLDGLALGGVLAAMLGPGVSGGSASKGARRLLVASGAGSIAYLAGGDAWSGPLGPSAALSLRMFAVNLMYFGLIGLVVAHAGHRLLSPLRDARLAYLGQMSYGIYLYHYIIFEIVQGYLEALGPTNRAAVDAIKLAASFALALASWRLVEQPLLTLKGRIGGEGGAARPVGPPKRAEVARLERQGSGV